MQWRLNTESTWRAQNGPTTHRHTNRRTDGKSTDALQRRKLESRGNHHLTCLDMLMLFVRPQITNYLTGQSRWLYNCYQDWEPRLVNPIATVATTFSSLLSTNVFGQYLMINMPMLDSLLQALTPNAFWSLRWREKGWPIKISQLKERLELSQPSLERLS